MKSIKTSLLFASVLLAAGVSFAASPPANQMVPVPKMQYDVENPEPYGAPTEVFHNRSGAVNNRQVYKVPAKGFVLAVKEDGDVVTRPEVINQKMYIVDPQEQKTNAPFKYREPK